MFSRNLNKGIQTIFFSLLQVFLFVYTNSYFFFRQYRSYQVRNGPSGKPLNLCDTRGLEEGQGIEAQDVCYILGGNTPDKYVVSCYRNKSHKNLINIY